jgi:Ti-type conjugative transfer relaxase TraA
MGLYSCSATVISRSGGRSAVASAAYRAGETLADERQGVVWDFSQRRGVLHSEILLPQNAPAWAADREKLWNAAEHRETGHAKQDSACVARDFRLALPHEATDEQRLEITREFGKYLVERYGGAVDFAIHAPDRRGDDRNFHAHVMMTSRRLEAGGLTKKIRELDDRKKGPLEITHIRETWERIQNRLHDQLGIPRVSCKTLDAQGLDREATLHMGVAATAMERAGEKTDLGDLNREIAARNQQRDKLKEERAEVTAQIFDLDAERAKRADKKEQQAIRSEARTLDPDRLLESMTERRATFTRADLNRHLTEFLPDAKARSAFTDHVLAREGVIPLRENEQAPVSRYTTRAVLDGEREVTAAAARMAKPDRHGVSARGVAAALDRYPFLDKEQRAALDWATRANGFAIIAGEAGTGKSTTFAAIREAYKADGFRVLGMSWKNDVVQDMRRDGFDQASTISAELMRQASGRKTWDSRTVLMIDEAGMIATKHFAALMKKAEAAGAKVILAGDKPQLGSIERGGMFGVLQDTLGAAFLTVVRRVKDIAEQGAWNAMHRGDFRAALETFDRRGAIHWRKTPEETRAALVTKWADDTAADPGKARFVFAYTNAEVHDLNAQLRAIRRDRGELGEDHVLKTKEGEATFAAGDRIQFTGNAATRARKDAGLYNGAAGTVETIDGADVTVAIDGAKGEARRVVSFTVGSDAEAGEFDAIRHGYAGTIYKGQGKTLDQTYLLHSDQWRSASSYVALSRHRESVSLFASEKASPWVMAEGGVAALNEKQHERAAQSYAAWKEAKPELAAKYGFADYVSYVQAQWADEKRLSPLDRLAQQMGRIEERRAASEFTQGAKPQEEKHGAGRTPHLSIVAGIVGDYLKLCYDPAIDWLRWVAEDLRHRAAGRRSAAAPQQGRDDVHTEGASASMDNADRIRRDPLPELPSGLDEKRGERRGADRVPPRPGTDPARNDGLRPLREKGGIEPPAAKPPSDFMRDLLNEAERETSKRGETPQKASDYLKGRGRSRGRDR